MSQQYGHSRNRWQEKNFYRASRDRHLPPKCNNHRWSRNANGDAGTVCRPDTNYHNYYQRHLDNYNRYEDDFNQPMMRGGGRGRGGGGGTAAAASAALGVFVGSWYMDFGNSAPSRSNNGNIFPNSAMAPSGERKAPWKAGQNLSGNGSKMNDQADNERESVRKESGDVPKIACRTDARAEWQLDSLKDCQRKADPSPKPSAGVRADVSKAVSEGAEAQPTGTGAKSSVEVHVQKHNQNSSGKSSFGEGSLRETTPHSSLPSKEKQMARMQSGDKTTSAAVTDISKQQPDRMPTTSKAQVRKVSISIEGNVLGRKVQIKPVVSMRRNPQLAGNEVEPSSPDREMARNQQGQSMPFRPRVDVRACKKKSSALSKEDLMKLISSPRSRQEHLQLNRLLQAHAEMQKLSLHPSNLSESEDNEGMESRRETDVLSDMIEARSFPQEIEVSALPLEVQREIDKLCGGVVSDFSDVESHLPDVINLTDDEVSDSGKTRMAVPDNGVNETQPRLERATIAAFERNRPISDGVTSPPTVETCSDSTVMARMLCTTESVEEIRTGPSADPCHDSLAQGVFLNSASQPVSGSASNDVGMRYDDVQTRHLVSVDAASSMAVIAPTSVTSSASGLQPLPPGDSSQYMTNSTGSHSAESGMLGRVLQISLREEEIRKLTKDTEDEIAGLERQLNLLKEQLDVKLNLKQKLLDEENQLRSLRLLLLKDSFIQHSEGSATERTNSETISSAPSEPGLESMLPEEADGHHQNVDAQSEDTEFGFSSVLSNAVINIEPIDDDHLSITQASDVVDEGIGFENSGNPVQPITIEPVEGEDASDDEERPGSCTTRSDAAGTSGCTVTGGTPGLGSESANGMSYEGSMHPVLPASTEVEKALPLHVEYVGTLNASNLQPHVLQQIALSLQPADSANVSANQIFLPSSIQEFSCSEDETVEPASPVKGHPECGGSKEKTQVPKKTTARPVVMATAVAKGQDDCVISRVEGPPSRKQNRGFTESEETAEFKPPRRRLVSSDALSVATTTASTSRTGQSHNTTVNLLSCNPEPSAVETSVAASTGLSVGPTLAASAHRDVPTDADSSNRVNTAESRVRGKTLNSSAAPIPNDRPNFTVRLVSGKRSNSHGPSNSSVRPNSFKTSTSSKRLNAADTKSMRSAAKPSVAAAKPDSAKRSSTDMTSSAVLMGGESTPGAGGGRDLGKVVSIQGGIGESSTKRKESASESSAKQKPVGVVSKRKRLGVDSPKGSPPKKKRSTDSTRKNLKAKRFAVNFHVYPTASITILYRHAESARSVVLSEEVIVTASDDGQIIRHHLPRTVYGLAEKQVFTGHPMGVVGLIATDVQVSRGITKTVVLSIGRDLILKMHCLQTGKVMMTHTFSKNVCYDCLCETGDTIFIGLEDGSIARLSTSKFSVKEPFTFPNSSRISALATSSDDQKRLLLIGFGDCTVSVRDAGTNTLVQTLRGHVRAPRFLLTCNKYIVSSSGDCTLFIHSLKGGDPLVNMLHVTSPVVAVTTVQTQKDLLLVASRNMAITCFDLRDYRRYVILLSTVEQPLTCLVASNHMIYFGCCNGLVCHADVDMRRHWKCEFNECNDRFFWKGDLEEHIREEHCFSNFPVLVRGQYQSICGWQGCSQSVSQRKNDKAVSHYLTHLKDLEPELTSITGFTN